MKTLLTLMGVVLLTSGVAHAKKNCTDQPKSKWMSIEKFKKQKEVEGYKIRKFKQPGTCYEIYGTDKNGKDVEIYFNPVDGRIVKSK
ncbi:MAG: PepSY domain-containing protein [Bdellovibrionales bacterium]|nr:PepSY domain-containing protein [Bdellovibrionales bacterium]